MRLRHDHASRSRVTATRRARTSSSVRGARRRSASTWSDSGVLRSRIEGQRRRATSRSTPTRPAAGRSKNRRIEFTILVDGGGRVRHHRGRGRRPRRQRDESRPAPGVRRVPPGLDLESLRRSTQANARAKSVSGLTRFDLQDRVTVPDGSSTMVAIINQDVAAEQTFLYRPGGAGTRLRAEPVPRGALQEHDALRARAGADQHLYRRGSFVGEGLSEAVGTGTSTTIPFAVEPGILVASSSRRTGEDMRIVRIVRGVIEVENFQRVTTTWTVKGQPTRRATRCWCARPSRAGLHAQVQDRRRRGARGRLPDPGGRERPIRHRGTLEVVEQTPSSTTPDDLGRQVPELLDAVLQAAQARRRAQA
jgi:hypothetical protein